MRVVVDADIAFVVRCKLRCLLFDISGFQSAVNLSRRLIQVLQSKGVDGSSSSSSSLDSSAQTEALLDGYFNERHAVVNKVIQWAIKNHETHTAMMKALAEEDFETFHALAASQRTHVRGIDQVTGEPFEVESVAMHLDSAGEGGSRHDEE